ncbi:MAG: mannitol dehydrogenase family protein [Synergistaceae bacterium]|nr:mannitol dehydrogenase family protein [Synergistaceae bacterium]
MRLDRNGLADRAAWEAAGIKTPAYDRETMIRATAANPRWLHFGTGNIFRAFIAPLQQRLLNEGLTDTGIIAASGYDHEVVERIYGPHDGLILSVGLQADGGTRAEVVASVAEFLRADEDRKRLLEIARSPSLQIVSLCITEKGYALTDMKGELLEPARRDMEEGPGSARHTMSLTASLLLERYGAKAGPVALLSLDNCSRNGDRLKDSVLRVARAWAERGFADEGFIGWLESEAVAFPWSMIDKITPRPSEAVRDELTRRGVEGMDLLLTKKGTYAAPFVNAEVPEYLVAEDRFPGGRPPLEKAGVYFTDRRTVENVERMKVTVCLNPLHTALAVCGCLLGYEGIAEEMKNPLLKALVERIGYAEGLPVAPNPGIFSPRDFLREVLEERVVNPFIRDTPQRIATDTSQKIPIRYGETIKAYMKTPGLRASDLVGIPLAIAAWFRYLLARDDKLRPMELSKDPLLEELRGGLAGIEPGRPETYSGQLRPFLRNPALFAADLFEAGLGEKIEGFFVSMLAGEDAVSRTLAAALDGRENPGEK